MSQHHPSVESVNSTILTKREAATFLRCSTRYVERQIRAGRLAACKPTGKFVRIRLKALEAFLESGSTTMRSYDAAASS